MSTPPNRTSTSTSRSASVPTPSESDCERAGCLTHCKCQPQDPWIYALIGAATGATILGTTMYLMGKKG